MPLTFPNGAHFATESTAYQYRPATGNETAPLLLLEVEIDGIRTEAGVDTGGVYLCCNPTIARLLSLTPAEALSDIQTMLLRGVLIHGRLYRLSLILLADAGEDVTIGTTAFVPEPEEAEHWGDMPCLLGLHGCLERARFAVDPHTEQLAAPG